MGNDSSMHKHIFFNFHNFENWSNYFLFILIFLIHHALAKHMKIWYNHSSAWRRRKVNFIMGQDSSKAQILAKTVHDNEPALHQVTQDVLTQFVKRKFLIITYSRHPSLKSFSVGFLCIPGQYAVFTSICPVFPFWGNEPH